MRGYESGNLFSYLCGAGGEWHSETNINWGRRGRKALTPTLSQWERERKKFVGQIGNGKDYRLHGIHTHSSGRTAGGGTRV
jgi:hypothetical protein